MADTYECKQCGSRKELPEEEGTVVVCCDQPMEKVAPLPFCTTSETAEHSRMDQLDEPCDDGRTGKI